MPPSVAFGLFPELFPFPQRGGADFGPEKGEMLTCSKATNAAS